MDLKFPKLEKQQVALLRCENSTGKILDIHLERYRGEENQKVYSLFSSKKEAFVFINDFLSKNLNIEVFLYDYKDNIIYRNDGIEDSPYNTDYLDANL